MNELLPHFGRMIVELAIEKPHGIMARADSNDVIDRRDHFKSILRIVSVYVNEAMMDLDRSLNISLARGIAEDMGMEFDHLIERVERSMDHLAETVDEAEYEEQE